MESMTGYAYIEKSTDQFSFSVGLKSLNSRYLETYINLPKILRNEENGFNTQLKKFFTRGKIELTIDIFDWTEQKPILLNEEVIKKYYHDIIAIHESLNISEPFRFEALLGLEGVSQRSRSVLSEKSSSEILRAVSRVIKQASQMRNSEGKAIKEDLLKSISEIQKVAAIIKKQLRNSSKERVAVLRKKLEEISGNKIEDSRFYTEISILADRLDVNEEIVRLTDHVKKFKKISSEQGQIGRKLDFVAQEMFREINTIGSKANNSEISYMVVELKNYIDKIREHCRNIV